MMLIRILLLLIISLSAEAAAPVISCTPSRTSGTEPFSVVFDCSGTTDADTSKPFHDLLYRTNFGDTNVGTDTWSNGANTNASKNVATGPIAAHVFESCVGSPFTVTHFATDGTDVSQTTNTITVACADDTFAGTATVCFFNSTVGSGCPSGAVESASSDWDAAIALCAGTTKRCLFKRGDSFAGGSDGAITASGAITIGAYGSGALPIVNVAASRSGILINSSSVNDIRIMDLNMVGTGAIGSENGISVATGTTPSNITILRVTISAMGGQGIAFANGTAVATKVVIQDSTISGSFNYEVYVRVKPYLAILGNAIGPLATGAAEHVFRTGPIQQFVFAHNTIQGAPVNKSVLTIRAGAHVTSADDSFYGVVHDNKIMQGTRTNNMMAIQPFDSGTDIRIYDVIVEKNFFLGQAYTGGTLCQAIYIAGVRITVRNNLFDLSAATTCSRLGVEIDQFGIEPPPDDVQVLNNTFFSSDTHNATGVEIRAGSTGTVAKNNVCWFDVAGTAKCISDAGTGTIAPLQPTAGGSSTNAQSSGTDPLFDNTASPPSGFRTSTSSYAATGGTAIWPASNDDFYSCDSTTADVKIGAFVPGARARCTSGAGP